MDIVLSVVDNLSRSDLTEPEGHHHIGFALGRWRPGNKLLYERLDIFRLIRRKMDEIISVMLTVTLLRSKQCGHTGNSEACVPLVVSCVVFTKYDTSCR